MFHNHYYKINADFRILIPIDFFPTNMRSIDIKFRESLAQLCSIWSNPIYVSAYMSKFIRIVQFPLMETFREPPRPSYFHKLCDTRHFGVFVVKWHFSHLSQWLFSFQALLLLGLLKKTFSWSFYSLSLSLFRCPVTCVALQQVLALAPSNNCHSCLFSCSTSLTPLAL